MELKFKIGEEFEETTADGRLVSAGRHLGRQQVYQRAEGKEGGREEHQGNPRAQRGRGDNDPDRGRGWPPGLRAEV
jgi:hypothetical protein